ncbi:hypothetical protein [Lachnoclostridium sp. An181]|uniref:hypothetical protein n=1 Tax=Lachnoclostridium sp. An181 TaxID=1965575 RepID=UPI000B398E7A|nr:hypothetical protein [Lachnoclostridium sp. An181]OUP50637.1 hypothetical protein B5F18_03105 [Lachnoclostridium sp. An181]
MTNEKAFIIFLIFLFWALATIITFAFVRGVAGNVRTIEALVLGKRKQGKKYFIQILINDEEKEIQANEKGYDTIENGNQVLLIRKNRVIGVRGKFYDGQEEGGN